MHKLGVVVCHKDSPNQFNWAFQIFEDAKVRTQKFVQAAIDGGYLLGKVTDITVFNEFYSDPRFVKHFISVGRPIKDHYPTEKRVIKLAYARSLAYYNQGTFHAPVLPPMPGSVVTDIDPKVLSQYLGVCSNDERGLYIGKVRNQKFKIVLEPNKLLSHHIAVLGATGSGKSYTNGVICEELLDLGIPVIIIDPHGEYDTMDDENRKPSEAQQMAFFGVNPTAYKIKEYAPLLSLKGKGTKTWQHGLTFDLSKLHPEMLGELMGLNSEPQLDLLYLSLKSLRDRREKTCYSLSDLDYALTSTSEEYSNKRTFLTLKRRLHILSGLRMFGKPFNPKEMIKERTLAVIDLSGDIDERVRRVICAAVLMELFESRKRKEIPPFFIVIEEGHRFCPQDEDCASKRVIRRIAREGRKFGVSVCMTSQRVIGLDKDVLSQLGTKIVLRVDNKSDLDYMRPYLAMAYSEEFRVIPILPEGVAIISGVAVRTPIIFKVRVRKSMHGGTSTEFTTG